MLTKGQIAKSVERKHNRNKSSVVALYKLLLKVWNGEELAPPSLVSACRTQASLARLKITEKGIHPVSLNTLKTVASGVVEVGGWRRLDELREQIKRQCNASADKIGSTKLTPLASKTNEIRELKLKLEKAQRTRAALNRAYFDAVTLLRSISIKDAEAREKLRRHEAAFGEQFGLRAMSGGAS